jgi:hypothetical protein
MKIQITDKILLRWVIVIFTFLILFLLSVLIKQNTKISTNLSLRKNLIKTYTFEKDSIIKAKNKDILYLLEVNKKKQAIIDKAFNSIDSLENEKEKIKIVYKERKDKIKELNGVELENYWKDEIK